MGELQFSFQSSNGSSAYLEELQWDSHQDSHEVFMQLPMGILVRISMKVSMGVSRGSPHNKQKAAPELLQTFLRASLELFTGKSLWDAPRSPCGSPPIGDSHQSLHAAPNGSPHESLYESLCGIDHGSLHGNFLLQSFAKASPGVSQNLLRVSPGQSLGVHMGSSKES